MRSLSGVAPGTMSGNCSGILVSPLEPRESWIGHTSAALHAAHNQLYIVSKRALYRIGLPPDEQTRAVKLAPLPQGMHRMTGSAYHPPSGRLVFWPGHNVVHVYDP